MIALCLIAGYVVFSVLLWAATWVVYLADCATRWAAPANQRYALREAGECGSQTRSVYEYISELVSVYYDPAGTA